MPEELADTSAHAVLQGESVDVKIPLFGKGSGSRGPGGDGIPPDVGVVGVRRADMCSARACPSINAINCDGKDEFGRPCPTAWCPDHGYVRDGGHFCPEHAGYATDDARSTMPPAARVASWVAREMDSSVVDALAGVMQDPNLQLVREPVRFVFFGVNRVRTWERGWKVLSHQGTAIRITLAIEESDLGSVVLRINGSDVLRTLVPELNELASRARRDAELAVFREVLPEAVVSGVEQWRQRQPVIRVGGVARNQNRG